MLNCQHAVYDITLSNSGLYMMNKKFLTEVDIYSQVITQTLQGTGGALRSQLKIEHVKEKQFVGLVQVEKK